MAKTTYSREELERQLAESRREFWAADATINNLEMKLSEMAAQLTNAENKCRELAAENEAIKFYLRNGPVIRKGGELVAAHQFAPKTPATDAFLAEARESAIPSDVMAAIQKVARIRIDLNDFDGDKRGIVDCLGEAEESLIEVVNKFAAQLCKGGNQ